MPNFQKINKQKPMLKDGYVCIRGFIVPSKSLKGKKQKDQFVAFMRNAKLIAIDDLKKRMKFSHKS